MASTVHIKLGFVKAVRLRKQVGEKDWTGYRKKKKPEENRNLFGER